MFPHLGTRRVSGARSEDGAAVAKGTEVVIIRYERGIAYVRPWAEFAEDAGVFDDRIAAETDKKAVQ